MNRRTAAERTVPEYFDYQLFNEFINDQVQIVYSDDSNIYLTLHDAYAAFKHWYGNEYNNNRYPNSFHFHNGMKERFGPMIDGKWSGIWIRNQEIIGF